MICFVKTDNSENRSQETSSLLAHDELVFCVGIKANARLMILKCKVIVWISPLSFTERNKGNIVFLQTEFVSFQIESRTLEIKYRWRVEHPEDETGTAT
ncbi:hypothetical protein BRE01_21230 [Brevibacillus reuszeri]|uniref:Uncharacterized protein n=1 Tax=Brevibacillus reuszeri TaxID=54915 RepID=A0ABQ0TKN8_9BACL|nr:hypothetical protein BRE01_21230 [Brevibacillus reuszeri]